MEGDMVMKSPIFIALFVSLWISICCAPASAGQNLPINYEGREIGSIRSMEIVDPNEDSPKMFVKLSADFPHFVKNLDEILQARGNLGGCLDRIFWRGNTSAVRFGEELRLSSRIGYERWLCWPKFLRKRILGSVGRIHWKLYINAASLNDIKINAQTYNIVGVPNWLEKWLGLHFKEVIEIPLPAHCGSCDCSELVDALSFRLESTEFSRIGENEEGIRLDALFSSEANLTQALRSSSDKPAQ